MISWNVVMQRVHSFTYLFYTMRPSKGRFWSTQMSENLSPNAVGQDSCHQLLTFAAPLRHGSMTGRVAASGGHTEPKHINQTSRKHIVSKHLVISMFCCPKPVVNVTSKIPLKTDLFRAWARSLQSYM